jgi:periplasmic divalent cation tolerance protein
MGGLLVWCPFGDENEAREVAGILLDEKLVACANIIPGMISLYSWQGERGETREVGVLFKTHASRREELLARLVRLHSYASPAIMIWNVSAAPLTTSDWLEDLAKE